MEKTREQPGTPIPASNRAAVSVKAPDEENWVVIGRLWRARGIRGELLGEFDSNDPEREQKLKTVALSLNGRRQVVKVEEVWRHNGQPVFKFVGIDSMTAAEVWERAEILVPPEEVAAPEEGAFSHRDLVDCRVEAMGTGSEIGVVRGVEEYGGPPLLQVETTDGREILIPFARAICKEIDVAAKVIRVELPDGLLELQ